MRRTHRTVRPCAAIPWRGVPYLEDNQSQLQWEIVHIPMPTIARIQITPSMAHPSNTIGSHRPSRFPMTERWISLDALTATPSAGSSDLPYSRA